MKNIESLNKAKSYTILIMCISLVCAILIWTMLLTDYNYPIRGLMMFIIDFPVNLIVAFIFMLFGSLIIGPKIHKFIFERNWNSKISGILGLYIISVFGIIGGVVSYFDYLNNSNESLIEYFSLPLLLFLILNLFPSIIFGIILGKLIAR